MPNSLIITGNEAGQKLGRFLRQRFSQLPLSVIHKFLRQKKIKIRRGERKIMGRPEEVLTNGDELLLYFDATKFGSPPPKKKLDAESILKSKFFKDHFQVAFEDEYLWIAAKQGGIAVHPGSKTPLGHSLIELFVAFAHERDPRAPEPKLAHRLDRDTSGLVLIAKNDATLRKLTAMIRDGAIEKKYLTLVKGKLSRPQGEIRLKLLRTEGSRFTKVQASKNSGAKEARTLYKVRSYFPEIDASLLEVTLDTGRMHQIRVHFASLGHPVAGDDAYGDFAWNRELHKKYGLKRQFLHAYALALRHPETGKMLHQELNLPTDLKKILPLT